MTGATRDRRQAGVSAVMAVAGLVLAAGPAAAQHATAFDVEEGGRAFMTSCANCHGPDGDEVEGVDLGHGQFRRASTDEDLVRIILNGVPDTQMPPSNFSEEQAARIVSYLRSLAAGGADPGPAGDAARGRALFEGSGECTTCHRVDGRGSRLGPDLSGIGRVRRVAELEQSLLDPHAEVRPENRFYRAVTRDGDTVTGRLLNLDTFTVQLLDSDEELRSFVKSDLAVYGFVDGTPMPSYRDRLTPQELADVVGYLASLKR